MNMWTDISNPNYCWNFFSYLTYFLSVIFIPLAKKFIIITNDHTAETYCAQRMHRDFSGGKSRASLACYLGVLLAAGSGSCGAVVAAGARVPAVLVAVPWAWPSGPATLLSGRACLPDKRSYQGTEGRSGLKLCRDGMKRLFKGLLVDFIVHANCFKQYHLFLSLWILYELKYNAILEINRTSPRTCQVPLQL
jgi:hypothetical protein